MSTYDHYSVASQIAKNLRLEGKSDWASKLDDAIQFGSTGNEIFMALRWHLQQFKLQGEKTTVETEQLMEDLLGELTNQLK